MKKTVRVCMHRSVWERIVILVIGVGLEVATWAMLFIAGLVRMSFVFAHMPWVQSCVQLFHHVHSEARVSTNLKRSVCAHKHAHTQVWINTAETVDIVIRSTVSIMFVLNVDELIFAACCVSYVKSDVEETRYKVRNLEPVVRETITNSFVNKYTQRMVKFRGIALKAEDTHLIHGRTSDAYLVFLQNGKRVGKTKVIRHNLNPDWPPTYIKVRRTEGTITIQCWDFDTITKDDLIGEVDVAIDDLTRVLVCVAHVDVHRHTCPCTSVSQIYVCLICSGVKDVMSLLT